MLFGSCCELVGKIQSCKLDHENPEGTLVDTNWTDIIEAASKSPLGILALVILASSALIALLFKNEESPRYRTLAIILFFAGCGAFSISLTINSSIFEQDAVDCKNPKSNEDWKKCLQS